MPTIKAAARLGLFNEIVAMAQEETEALMVVFASFLNSCFTRVFGLFVFNFFLPLEIYPTVFYCRIVVVLESTISKGFCVFFANKLADKLIACLLTVIFASFKQIFIVMRKRFGANLLFLQRFRVFERVLWLCFLI